MAEDIIDDIIDNIKDDIIDEIIEFCPYEQTMTYFFARVDDLNAVDIRQAKFAIGDCLCVLSIGDRFVVGEDAFGNRYLQKT